MTDRPDTKLHPAIPRVLCPKCGKAMRLVELEPTQRDGDKMVFDCSCGYEHEMPVRSNEERSKAA